MMNSKPVKNKFFVSFRVFLMFLFVVYSFLGGSIICKSQNASFATPLITYEVTRSPQIEGGPYGYGAPELKSESTGYVVIEDIEDIEDDEWLWLPRSSTFFIEEGGQGAPTDIGHSGTNKPTKRKCGKGDTDSNSSKPTKPKWRMVCEDILAFIIVLFILKI
uniref:Transmembrane protein n=1 Tax=Caulerpa lentillifera TaxID=148947 RepID=A0A7D4ZVR6_9CHLO|nr:hypothetical protein [Caulerpa lentillifera]